jgi:hypothetical protein
MAKKAIMRGPDLDSARRDADTGLYTDKASRLITSRPRPMNGPLRSPVGRLRPRRIK